MELLLIDGSILEGGGQILRNASSLSCLKKQPVKIQNIRAKRSKPGLSPQHLCGLRLLADISRGKLKNAAVRSTEIIFEPSEVQSGVFAADTGTAGSVCLMIQSCLPVLIFGGKPSTVNFRGGTNADMAPQIDFFTLVLEPYLNRMGMEFDCKVIRRGFFPAGGGVVELTVHPLLHLQPLNLTEFGTLLKITGFAFVCGKVPYKVAERMNIAAEKKVKRVWKDVPYEVECTEGNRENSFGTGCCLMLVAHTSTGCRLVGSAIGQKDKSAEDVGNQAAQQLLNNLSSGSCCDEFTQDQLILFMALAKGQSCISVGQISLHTQTAIHFAELLTDAKFTIKQLNEDLNLIECEGIGYTNPYL